MYTNSRGQTSIRFLNYQKQDPKENLEDLEEETDNETETSYMNIIEEEEEVRITSRFANWEIVSDIESEEDEEEENIEEIDENIRQLESRLKNDYRPKNMEEILRKNSEINNLRELVDEMYFEAMNLDINLESAEEEFKQYYNIDLVDDICSG